MVAHKKCKSQPLTPNGGKLSSTLVNTSSIQTTRRHLMFSKERILKDKKSLSGRDIMVLTKDGELSTLINLSRKELLDLTKNSDSISIEHSTSDQDSQCGELLKMSPTISDSEDSTTEEEDNKLGSLIEFRIPSSQNTLNHTPFT
jgi:hypothetical protein